MKLTAWTWLIAGIIVAGVAGYVYLFFPKNGEPNTPMALFFFIGMIFIIVGIAKLFFRRIDDKSVMDSIAAAPVEQKIVTMPTSEYKPNKVEEMINQLAQQQEKQLNQQQSQLSNQQNPSLQQQVRPTMQQTFQATPVQKPSTSVPHSAAQGASQSAQQQHTAHKTMHNSSHTNSFSGMYQYKGPVHTASSGTHAQHPVGQHAQSTHTASTHSAHHPVQNTAEHSVKCRKCGNANAGHANYCHGCGNRLK